MPPRATTVGPGMASTPNPRTTRCKFAPPGATVYLSPILIAIVMYL